MPSQIGDYMLRIIFTVMNISKFQILGENPWQTKK
jgi:hypothetical protein